MSPLAWLGLGLAGLVTAIAFEAWARRGKHRPLARHHPQAARPKQAVPLGMEATGIEAFQKAVRSNTAFMDKTSVRGDKHSWTEAHSQPFSDDDAKDETYATRFHAAFGKTETKK